MTTRSTEAAASAGVFSPNQAVLELLVCPKCRGHLLHREADNALDCLSCVLRYPIEDGIPVLMSDRGVALRPRPGRLAG